MNLAERESEILRVLDLISKSPIRSVVVGGYAVSALTKHRFSVDCDLVVRDSDVENVSPLLEREGFTREVEKDRLEGRYGGGFARYSKTIQRLPVSVDLLVGGLVCRQTEASWSYDYIITNSVMAIVTGLRESVRARVAKRELLMAFKLHSARKADIRDVIMLGEEADWDVLQAHLKRGSAQKLENSLARFIESLDDKRLTDSLKGEFSLQEDIAPRLERSRRHVQRALDALTSDN